MRAKICGIWAHGNLRPAAKVGKAVGRDWVGVRDNAAIGYSGEDSAAAKSGTQGVIGRETLYGGWTGRGRTVNVCVDGGRTKWNTMGLEYVSEAFRFVGNRRQA